MSVVDINVGKYLDQYKLRHSEVVLAALPGNQYMLKDKIDKYLGERGQVAVDLGDYPAYMAINPSRLSRKKQYFVAHVPHHDIGAFIGERGRNISLIASNLAEVYRNQFPELSEDLKINIIILPLFIENQMVIKEHKEKYIYKITLDMENKDVQRAVAGILSDNHVYPLYSENYYKKGKHRSVLYFKGRDTAESASELILRESTDSVQIGPSEFYQKVKEAYVPDLEANPSN